MMSDEALGVLSSRGGNKKEAAGAAFVDASEVEEATRRSYTRKHVVFLPKVDDATSKGNERRV